MSIEKKAISRPISRPQEQPAAKSEDQGNLSKKDQTVFRDWAAI